MREADTFLAVAFPHDQMQVLPYHRVVKDLAGHTPESLLQALRERLTSARAPTAPPGRATSRCTSTAAGTRCAWPPRPPTRRRPIGSTSRCSTTRCSAPLLGIGDPRTDTRIDFVGGIRGPGALANAVDKGTAAVAFAMYPVRDRGPHGHRRRRWHHAAQVHLVRAEAPRRPAQSTSSDRPATTEPATMKVLVADQFEQSGLRRPRAAGCDVVFDACPQGRRARRRPCARAGAEVLVVRSTKVTAAMMDAGELALIVRAGAGYNTIDVGGRLGARDLRVELPGQERDRGGRAHVGADPRARSPDSRTTSPSCARAAGTRRSSRRRRASRDGRSGCSASATSARRSRTRAQAFGHDLVIWSSRLRRRDGRRPATATTSTSASSRGRRSRRPPGTRRRARTSSASTSPSARTPAGSSTRNCSAA